MSAHLARRVSIRALAPCDTPSTRDRVACRRSGVQPPHRSLRTNATGLQRLRELGHQRRAARRQLGTDRTRPELPARHIDVRHPHRQRRRCGLAGRTRRRAHHGRPHARRRHLRRPRRERLPTRRGRRLGTEQRHRRLEHVHTDGTSQSTRQRPRGTDAGQPARDRSRQLAKQRSHTFRCGKLRRRWPLPRRWWTAALTDPAAISSTSRHRQSASRHRKEHEP